MRARPHALIIGLGLGLAALSLSGCADNDACKGRSETCLSLTLTGEAGVMSTDQLQLLFMRKVAPNMPMMALGSPQDFPFKVAVLWPDGPATISVHAMLSGQLAGVSPELAMDLRNGQHEQRKLSLYPPLPGVQGPDMAKSHPDMRQPADLAPTPPDLTDTPDLAELPHDLSMPPLPDLALPPPDQSEPAFDL